MKGLLERIPSIEKVILVAYTEKPDLAGLPRAVHYQDFLAEEKGEIQFEQLPFDHPVYILYSSGTTGVPKCIVHGAGGTLLQHLKELKLHTDLKREDVIFYFTTCGWMMWNWLVSALAVGSTLVLYDGSPSTRNRESCSGWPRRWASASSGPAPATWPPWSRPERSRAGASGWKA